jgi:small subunit ribosomal protein S1
MDVTRVTENEENIAVSSGVAPTAQEEDNAPKSENGRNTFDIEGTPAETDAAEDAANSPGADAAEAVVEGQPTVAAQPATAEPSDNTFDIEGVPAETDAAQDAGIETPELEAATESTGNTGDATAEAAQDDGTAIAIPEEDYANMSLMERLLLENETASNVRKLEYGQAIEGILMYKDKDDMLVDIGTKSEGIVPQRERQSLTGDRLAELKVGDRVLVVVVRPEGLNGEEGPILSIDKARTEVSWRKLQQQYEAGDVFEVSVIGYNKGGLMVECEGVRGFIPASQVNALTNIGDSEENRQSQMSRLVNSKLVVKIVEVNRDRNRLILSERQAVNEQRKASKERLMAEIEKGQIREGVVTTLAKFGAFVDLGGVDGLVHVSELSWARVDDPKQVLQVGQTVKVYILEIDLDKQKVALSIKRTQPEPWKQVQDKYQVGEVVEATISQLSNFGAFARLEEGLEGLIHISELAEGRVEKPGDIVKPGDKVKVRILRIDPDNKRLALSLKRANDPGEATGETEEESQDNE